MSSNFHTPLPKDHMCFLLPSGIDPNDPAWGSGERNARIAYVMHFISTRQYDNWRPFVAVHTPTIKSIINRAPWDDARTKLAPYWEIDHRYLPGDFSKGYRWNDQWSKTECVDHFFHCPRFKCRVDSIKAEQIKNLSPVESGVYRDLLKVDCQIEDVDAFLRALPDKSGIKCEFRRRSYYKGSILLICKKSYDIGQRSKNGRMYHSLSRTPRLVRETLTIAGERAVEVDLANSQPYFMAACFPEISGLAASVSAGTFYASINACLDCPWDLAEPDQKSEQKKLCIQYLYGKPIDRHHWNKNSESKLARIERAMGAAFPGLPECLLKYADKQGSTALANDMQKRESEVFIDDVLPLLQSRGIPAVPIHDSFLCRESDGLEIKRLLTEKLTKHTGIRPLIR